MITAALVLGFTALINFVLGLVVYLTQPKRPQNRYFAVFSLIIGVWATCMTLILITSRTEIAGLFIRIASYTAVLLPVGFYWLCLAIAGEIDDARSVVRHTYKMLIASQLAGLLCFTPWYLAAIEIIPPEAGQWAPPKADYGQAFLPYNLYFLLAFGWVVFRFVRIIRRSQGLPRTELQFVVLGMGTTLAFTLSTNVIIPALTGSSMLQPFGPLGFLAMNAIMAYGIVTRRVLEVAVILRRIAAYSLLLVYLSLMYSLIVSLTSQALRFVTPQPGAIPYILGTIAIALSVAPAQGRMQRLANKLFITAQPIDVRNVISQATVAMQSIATVDELLDTFTGLVASSLDSQRVMVLLPTKTGFEQRYPPPLDTPPVAVGTHSDLAQALRSSSGPMVVDIMRRRRLSPMLERTMETLVAMEIPAAVAVKHTGQLKAIMLLGPRVSGRVYGAQEEQVMQIYANELAVAIENASLFTETRNSHIYNNILLDSLVSGVIAVDSERQITVFNKEARRILRTGSRNLIGSPIAELPGPLQTLLETTLISNVRLDEQEFEIPFGDATDHIHVRAGGAVFHAHTGETLGALLVFHDITQLKTLEIQIRRQDRLASMGTLSAGMAHEIKNPLVTIKTFTQLLPERYEDTDFRNDFTTLVGNEVRRIDGIVNQLLTFARPSKPTMTLLHLHDVLGECLQLVKRQMEQSRVQVTADFCTSSDVVMGDANLLKQAFLNFLLNAREAMGDGGGTLQVTTTIIQQRAMPHSHRHMAKVPRFDSSMLIRIIDDGPGIQTDDLPRVFDPFFTTKSSGTGLGLAVAHGIIQEQNGIIDVNSEVGKGTTFMIYFPRHEAKEARA